MRPDDSIRNRNRRLNRAAAIVIDVMRTGQCLHLEFNRMTGPRWCLSNGVKIGADVARLVVASPAVSSDGDALFPDITSQTWRACK